MKPFSSRGRRLIPQGENGFDQCWYPLALSDEVLPGQVLGREFLDGKVVVFRTPAGDPRVFSAFCRHLGADLSLGHMVDGKLRCLFHSWLYNSEGACSTVPAGDSPPPMARLFRYPAAESMGLVWAFNGEKPLYAVPRFDTGEDQLAVRAYEAPNVLPVDPVVQLLNAFDVQHFKVVHGLDLDADDYSFGTHMVDCVFTFTAPELGRIRQARRIWGTTCVTMNGIQAERPIHFAGSLCAIPGNRTRMYVSNATPRGDGSPQSNAGITQALDNAKAYALRLIGEDWPILSTISFRIGLMTASDKLLGQALRWTQNFPRAHPGQDFIRNGNIVPSVGKLKAVS